MAVVFALASALAWGCADFIGGVGSRRFGVLPVLLLIEGGGLAVMTAVVVALQPEPLPSGLALQALAAGALGVTGLGLFYRAMAIGTVSVAAPVAATGVVLPVAAGVLGGERPSAAQWIGLLAIIAGVMLASREQSGVVVDAGAARRSVLLALVAAVCFGAFYILIAEPSQHAIGWTVLLIRAAPVPVLFLLWRRSRAPLPPRRTALALAAAGSIDLAATVLIAAANQHGDLSIVAVLSSMYPVATVLLAAAFLHERLLASQYVGVVLALGGIVAVAGG